MAVELSPELVELETRAWAEIQAGALTAATAERVQDAVTAHAVATGGNRYELEMALKRAVRGAE
ncbi:hypothetical protein [Streptomyces sp. NPDC059176]|uniref:hypothetical protein n=1 Tax=Streptomyces sp. NPDC059176 TaxID=3346758 RepID=UPI003674F3A8